MSTISKPPIAAIDIGSNSFRLLVAPPGDKGLFAPFCKRTKTVRLGRGLAKTGRLAPDAISRGLEALAEFRNDIDRFKANHLMVCATQALREAANSHEFISRAQQVLSTKIEVIPAAQEARLTLAGCRGGIAPQTPAVMAIDSGGGSTEIILEDKRDPEKTVIHSFAVGAVNMTEKFLTSAGLPADTTPLAAHLDHIFQANPLVAAAARLGPDLTLIGTGGSATTLAALDLGLNEYDQARVQGHHLSADALGRLTTKLSALSVAGRNALPALDRGRGEIIVAGAMIFLRLMAALGQKRITVSDFGLLEGIFLAAAAGNGCFYDFVLGQNALQ